MDWIPGVIVALIGVAGVLLGQKISSGAAERASEREWERHEVVREQDWKRDAARRWDEQRVGAYADLTAATLTLVRILDEAGPYWEKAEELPADLLRSFEDQREEVTRAHMLAAMLASRAVRVELRRLWARTLDIGSALDTPSDGTQTAIEMTRRHSNEIGTLIGVFRVAVAKELGIDEAES